MLPLLLAGRRQVPSEKRLVTHTQAATFLMQSGVSGMGFFKEKWTEAEVLALNQA
jgi:hypothetical protein